MTRFIRIAAFAAALLAIGPAGVSAARAATDIDLFFPVPVQGKLAVEMQRLIGEFNAAQSEVKVTPVYTGSYDDTSLKTHAAIAAGHPPAAVIMSANFVREYVITGETMALDGLIAADGLTPAAFMGKFWPALRPNAMDGGHVYGVPFHNSTALLYYNTDAFREAGLDAEHPPQTWQEWLDALRKLTRPAGPQQRWGIMIPGTYDYLGWLTSTLAMSNGGLFYNTGWGGEVYYNAPSTIGAVELLDNFAHRDKVMPEGVLDANAITTAFFTGKTAMMILSTGSLSFVRENMKLPYKVAFIPRNLANAAPIGGASLIIPKGNSPERVAAAWKLIAWLTSPAVAGGWSRFTGYFAPNMAAYDLPEMKAYLAANPDAKVALDQLNLAGRPWFATYNTVGVRKALEDGVQAVLSGKAKPAEAMAAAQQQADLLMRPYVDQTALKLPQ
jgi:sn-glycerol 3-phosphate transport system substrate-binding protein